MGAKGVNAGVPQRWSRSSHPKKELMEIIAERYDKASSVTSLCEELGISCRTLNIHYLPELLKSGVIKERRRRTWWGTKKGDEYREKQKKTAENIRQLARKGCLKEDICKVLGISMLNDVWNAGTYELGWSQRRVDLMDLVGVELKGDNRMRMLEMVLKGSMPEIFHPAVVAAKSLAKVDGAPEFYSLDISDGEGVSAMVGSSKNYKKKVVEGEIVEGEVIESKDNKPKETSFLLED